MTKVDSRVSPPPAHHGPLFILLIWALSVIPFGRAQVIPLRDGENEPQNGGNVELPWQARDQYDRLRFMNEASSHYILKHGLPPKAVLVFFPPVPPALDSEIPMWAPLDSGPPAPPELAAFVGEAFYPLLGRRLATDDLPKALRARIVSYRDRKTGIQNELRSRILALKDADPESRESQLAALAAQQAQPIAEIEAEAMDLRRDLRPTGVLGLPPEGPDLSESFGRQVASSRDRPSSAAELKKQVDAIRGAAFFQEGLSLDQRYLLVEAAMELEAGGGAAHAAPGAAPAGRMISFAPEPARILLPDDLPPGLGKRIDDYLSAKGALKAEIRDTLHDSRDSSGDERLRLIGRLAAAQAPRIAALEAAAEDIRRDLAVLPSLRGPPAPPSLPASLTSRIAAYRRHKVELLKTLRAMLVAPSPAPGQGPSAGGTKADDGTALAQAWLHDGTSTADVAPSSLRVSVAEFDRLQNDLISALNKEESGIRESLAEYVRATNGPADRKSINDLLMDFENARQLQDLWDRYRDYQNAVLMPGLSAGQRRVLFDAGIEQLGLPLPDGERAD